VLEHRLGQDERPDEGEDGGRSERREHIGRLGHPEDDDQGDADQAADRDRHRLGDPEDDDAEQQPAEHLLAGRDAERQREKDEGDGRGEEEADRTAPSLESFFGRGQLLFAQTAVGRTAEQAALHIGLGAVHASPLDRVIYVT
jgi:hypothetical protein